jgi:uncharacterized coiled-coil protein SlyX
MTDHVWPLTQDLVTMQQLGAEHPMETMVRLEALRRELSVAMHRDPERCANLAFALENIRAAQERQLQWALGQLAERQAQIELLEAQLAGVTARLQRLDPNRPRRWWPW